VAGYRLEGELGRGGAAVVHRARAADGAPVALKLLLAPPTNEVQRKRFEREVQALTRLRHPNLVRLLDAGQHQGRFFLVLELVEGQDLQERLDRAGPLPTAEAVAIARDLSGALDAIHAAGLLHRDVKPANVLIDGEGRPRLTDFGIVKDLDASKLSVTGSLVGSPGYWSPEQAAGGFDALGPPSDVYALGATLYALLTGVAPFVGETLADCLERTMHQVPAAPSKERAEVDARVDRVVLRCLEKAPEARYGSARDLAEALEACLAPAPVGRRWRRLALAGALALSASAAAVAEGVRRGAEADLRAGERAAQAPTAAGLMQRGHAALGGGDLERAKGYYRHASELDPEDANPHGYLALVALQERDWEAARHGYGRALEDLHREHPSYDDLCFGLAMALRELGDDAAAEEAVSDAIATADGSPAAFLHFRRDLRGERGDLEGAHADQRAVVELVAGAPDEAHHQAMLGRLCVRMGRHPEAVAAFEASLAVRANPHVSLLRARSLARIPARQREALAAYGDAIRLGGNAAAIYRERADLRVSLGDVPGAVSDLEASLSTTSDPGVVNAVRRRIEGLRR
jgi:serine/threonine-protein kinase